MGVMLEIAQAVEDLHWLLPTDVQAESIPLIIGGGDELSATENGSGKYYYKVTCHDQGLCGIGWSTSLAALYLGNDLGVAFEIPQQLKSQPFFASCVLKNAELKFNSGGEDFKNAPKSGFVAMDQRHAVKSTQACVWIPPYFICKKNRYGIAKVSQVKATSNSPKALIIEPSKELAEQTLNNVI
ncbi:hypothetical protein JOQ06_004405 [Pogonophryne albipinna]|uniref:RNA helicase n=1 Tax=Pogonophryne albipinna TaxID=1090488 RepID=A0AAD6AR21_9TELE|nr:hypothetical protein JOQ06_004405 [Pogonophryne albipinna]